MVVKSADTPLKTSNSFSTSVPFASFPMQGFPLMMPAAILQPFSISSVFWRCHLLYLLPLHMQRYLHV